MTAEQKSAIVTGGGTGIGFATAKALSQQGFAVTLAGRRADVLSEAANTLTATDPNVDVDISSVDVGDRRQVETMFGEHVARWGAPAVVVINAGVYRPSHFLDTTVEDWDSSLTTNVTGAFHVGQVAARHMVSGSGGRIVLIGSVTGLQAERNSAPYSTSKAALEGLCRAMAVDLAEHEVTVNLVAPGWTRTAMAIDDIDALGREGMRGVNPCARAVNQTKSPPWWRISPRKRQPS